MLNRREIFGTVAGALASGATASGKKPIDTGLYIQPVSAKEWADLRQLPRFSEWMINGRCVGSIGNRLVCAPKGVVSYIDKPTSYTHGEWDQQLAARAKGLHVIRFWHEGKQVAPAVEKKIGEDFTCRIRIGDTLYRISGAVVATDNPGLHRCSASIFFHDGVRMAAVSEDPGVEIFLFDEGRRVLSSPKTVAPLGSW